MSVQFCGNQGNYCQATVAIVVAQNIFSGNGRCTFNIMGFTSMGNNQGASNISEDDMEFLKDNTSLTSGDVSLYENFLKNHPDGTISRQDFR